MKTNILITTLLAFSAIVAQAQSSLTPPAGPPAATSHTINEVYDKAATIEGQNTAQTTKIDSIQTQVTNLSARRPLIAGSPGVTISANGTINVSSPGSYYLTNNKLISSTGAHGIAITTSDVTIDLNGFALQCGSGTGGSAIYLNDVGGARQIHISNGFIRGGSAWNGTTFTGAGWTNGISGAAADVTISNVTVTGMRNNGIDCVNATVSNCNVSHCGDKGINASIVDKCRAMKCFTSGIIAVTSVDHSEGESVTTVWPVGPGIPPPAGINVTNGRASHSIGRGKAGVGLRAESASHCKGTNVAGDGLYVTDSADHCVGDTTTGYGLSAAIASNCIGQAAGSLPGLSADIASYCKGTNYTSGQGWSVHTQTAVACLRVGNPMSATTKLATP